MSQNKQEEQNSCKEARFVDKNYAELVQRVTLVLALADDLKSKDMIHEEMYSKIAAEKNTQDQMRKLYEALRSGGETVKKAFYYALGKIEVNLFEELGGDNRKRKPSDAECQVPAKRKKPNTESDKALNCNEAPQICNFTNIYTVQEKVGFLCPAPKKEKKPPAPMKVKKPPAPKKEKKPPAPMKVKKPPAPKKVKKPPAPKKVKKPPAPKKEKKPPAPKKVKKPPAPKKVKKPPAPKKEKKPPAPKKVKKPPAPKKVKKPPAPKKVKKPPAPKKEKKPPAPKKVKKPPAPKKVKKPPAPKKVKKPPAPKK